MAVLLLAALPEHAFAQSPAPAPQPHSFNLGLYFADAQHEAQALQACQAEADQLAQRKPSDGASLLQLLEQSDALLGKLRRHAAYWKAIGLRDIHDIRVAPRNRSIRLVRIQVFDAANTALESYGAQRFEKDMQTTPGLKRYAHLVRNDAQDKLHSLPAGEAAVLSQVGGLAQSGSWAMYQQLERTAPFGKIQTRQGERDVYTDAAVLALDPDRTVRQEAWQRYWGAFEQRQDLFATTLLGIVRQHDLKARLHHYPDAPAQLYAASQLSREEVNQGFAQVRAGSGLLKRYQRLRAQRIAQEYGIADVHAWDSQLPARGLTPPRLTLDETLATALVVLQPLGDDYVTHFRDLLNPANGRLDVSATKGSRASNSTSVAGRGAPVGLFVEVYDSGLVSQSDAVIHEGGHAVHNQYMNEAGVSEFAIAGPRWMFEAFAHLNGYLLLDHLVKTAPDAATRAYYLEAYLNKLSLEIFGSAQEGLLEQEIYEGVAAGTIKNAADLNALTHKIWSEFEIWPDKDPALQHYWMGRRLFFNDPLFYFNYLFAGGLSLKLVDMAQTDPAGFAPRYNRLLRAGFSETPQTLLKEFFGRDISQGDLMRDAMHSFEAKLNALEKTYAKMDAAKPK